MGRRGPPPKPTALRLLEGNPSHRPINRREPKPERVIVVDPPDDLPEAGKAVWRQMSAELGRVGLLTVIDLNLFARYIYYLLEYREANKNIIGYPLLFPRKDSEGKVFALKANPYAAVRDRAHTFMLQLENQLGLSPAARSRILANIEGGGNGGDDDPYA